MINLLCLIEFYNTYDHDDIFHEISKKMLDDFASIGNMGMQELADSLFISTSTLYRFIKKMSYENHNQMRQCQQMFLEYYMCGGRYMSKQIDVVENFNEYGDYLCRNIKQITSNLSVSMVNEITQAILTAENIIFVGMPMPSAIWRLQIELIMLNKKTSAFLNPIHQQEAVSQATGNDCIFLVQYLPEESSFYLDIAKEAKEKGIPTVLVSNIPISPTLQYIKYPISFEGDMCESDMLMIEVILNAIGNQLNKKVLELKKI